MTIKFFIANVYICLTLIKLIIKQSYPIMFVERYTLTQRKKILSMKDDDSMESLTDVVTEEFKFCQLEKIPSSFCEVKPK